jgi:hypothetical protein
MNIYDLLVNSNVQVQKITEIDWNYTFPFTGIIFLMIRNVPIYMAGFANETLNIKYILGLNSGPVSPISHL